MNSFYIHLYDSYRNQIIDTVPCPDPEMIFEDGVPGIQFTDIPMFYGKIFKKSNPTHAIITRGEREVWYACPLDDLSAGSTFHLTHITILYHQEYYIDLPKHELPSGLQLPSGKRELSRR